MRRLIQFNRESTKNNDYVMQQRFYEQYRLMVNRCAQAHQYKWTIVKSIKIQILDIKLKNNRSGLETHILRITSTSVPL